MTLHLHIGQVFGELTLLKRLPYKKGAPVNLRRWWRVRCSCGEEFSVPQYYLIRKSPPPKTHCGCANKSIKTHHNREYRIWIMMHRRCEHPDHVSYQYYGQRGIKVCPEWHRDSPDGKGFDRFLEFIGPAPSLNHSIDRINNDQGYQPYFEGKRQVRWATDEEQANNKRKPFSTGALICQES